MPRKSSAVAEAATIPLSSGRFELVPVCDVSSSELNPRRHFDDAAHAELVESVKKHGVLQPILVRPLPGGGFEIVAGERRWRAAKAAKLVGIPAMVREMDDKAALEIAVVENLQRTDLHPLEEADGYRRLIDEHGYHVEQLAAKVGKSKAYIYARLKLAEMPAAARELFHAGHLDASTALLVARIANVEHAERAARVIAGQPNSKAEEQEWRQAGGRAEYSDFGDALEDLEPIAPEDFDRDGSDDDDEAKRKPLTFRQAQVYVRQRFMLRLDEAPFPTADAGLITGIGACSTCPKRTGAQPELFADVKNGDVCTDLACFDAKKMAHRDRVAQEAEEAGKHVLTAKEAKGVIQYGSINRGSGYAEPKGECPIDPDGRTWPQVLKSLGKTAPVKCVVIDPDTGKAIDLVRIDAVAAALKAKGIKPKVQAQGSGGNDSWKRQQEAERKKREAQLAERDACIAVIVSAVEGLDELPVELLRVVALGTCAQLDADWAPMLRRRGLAPPPVPGQYDDIDVDQVLRKAIAGMDEAELRGLLVDMALTADQPHYGNALGLLELAAKALSIDLKPIRAAAKKAHQAAVKALRRVAVARDNAAAPPARCRACAQLDCAGCDGQDKDEDDGKIIQCRACNRRVLGAGKFAEHVATEHADEPTCVRCGCQEDKPCPGGCAWTTTEPGPEGEICTECVTDDDNACEHGISTDITCEACQALEAGDAGEEE